MIHKVTGKPAPQEFGCDYIRSITGKNVPCCGVCHKTNNGEVYFSLGGVRRYLCCSVSTYVIEIYIPNIQLEIEDIGPIPSNDRLYLIIGKIS